MKVFSRKKEREEIERDLHLAKEAVLGMRGSGADVRSAAQILRKAITNLKKGRYEEARTEVQERSTGNCPALLPHSEDERAGNPCS
jgi:hypothetical protein